MIILEKDHIDDLIFLQVVEEKKREEGLPTVIYYHGFNGEKESSLTLAYKIARKGIRVILPDAPLHGERALSADPVEHGVTFWKIVKQAVTEIEALAQYLEQAGLLLNHRLGLGGTSMGGMITYAALSQYDWIQAAAVLMGTPYLSERAKKTMAANDPVDSSLLKEIEALDITKNLSALNKRPLFIWHGEKDEIVPVVDSRNFYHLLSQANLAGERIQFIEEKDRVHHISKLSMNKTADWFASQL